MHTDTLEKGSNGQHLEAANSCFSSSVPVNQHVNQNGYKKSIGMSTGISSIRILLQSSSTCSTCSTCSIGTSSVIQSIPVNPTEQSLNVRLKGSGLQNPILAFNSTKETPSFLVQSPPGGQSRQSLVSF